MEDPNTPQQETSLRALRFARRLLGRVRSTIDRISLLAPRGSPPPAGIIPLEYIEHFLPRSPIVVEAGAHAGHDTVAMSQRWRQGTIHAFEPVPDLFRQLCENTQGLYNVYCYPFALGEKSGTATMFISSGTSDGSSSLLCPKEVLAEHPTVLFKDKIAVPVVTLDDWAKGNDIAKVDFLWLDVQGYELAVLKAAENVLRSVRAIYAEVNLKQLYEGGALYPELKEWLANRGFQVQREELPWPDAGNVLFVRRDNQTHGSAPSTPLPGYKPDFR